jgi:hypothetical protein
MQEVVIHAGGYNVESIAIRNQFNNDPLDKKNKKKIAKGAKKLEGKIQRNKPPLFSILFSKIAIQIGLKPFVFRNVEHNFGIINSWKEKGIIK